MKKIDYKLLIISVGISAGLVLFVIGMSTGLSGRDASNLPEAIEQISPGQGDQVLQQSQIIVDFIEGYTATLTIDGIELPTTRLDEVVATGKQIAPGAGVTINTSGSLVIAQHGGGTLVALSASTFTFFSGAAAQISVDFLVLAGGAGGSMDGGGGAGGLRSTVTATGGGGTLETALVLKDTNYVVSIGAGGAGVVTASTDRGAQGTNTIFASIVSTGGGGGGSGGANRNGASGGSGGGGMADGTNGTGGAAASPTQGFAGGGSTSVDAELDLTLKLEISSK